MENTNVLISGASIAGPALACWLTRYGFNVTVVEKAPGLRPGGQAVDFKGVTQFTVLSRMGILDDVRAAQTGGSDGTIVDERGRKLAVIPGEFTGGDLEISRSDLSRVLYDRTSATCEYLFGDSITSLTETASGVHVTFNNAAPRTFDLVVGADGIHSNVRKLAFGPEADYVQDQGYYYALADLDLDGEGEMYNEPGRMAATGGPKAPAFFVFASEPLDYDRNDVEQQKKLVLDAYRGGAWRIPEMLARIPDAKEFYLDSLSRAKVDHYSRGRVVLLGDSAYGNTLGGFGSGLAVVGAYVLAGELFRAHGDYRVAFAQYDAKFRKYANGGLKSNAGPFLAPPSRFRMRMRNWMFSVPVLFSVLMKVTDKFATDIELEDYGLEFQRGH